VEAHFPHTSEEEALGDPEPGHWFEPLAEHLGRAYLRYSFTKGTRQEVDFLVGALELGPGMRVLDVGYGPGRHAHELARRGIATHGVDISATFIDLARAGAPPGATFERLDARALPFDATFDAAISLCQGAFGLLTELSEDLAVLRGMTRAVRPGRRLALSAFSSYFQVRHLDPETTIAFDAATGVHHERIELRDSEGTVAPAELWTHCFTPTELRLLADAAGLDVDAVWSVEPGRYEAAAPTIDTPEFLLVATRPADTRLDTERLPT
jgi:SAM-dependent methyltransferase